MFKRSKAKVFLGVVGGLSEKIGIPKFLGRTVVGGVAACGFLIPAVLGYAALYYVADHYESKQDNKEPEL